MVTSSLFILCSGSIANYHCALSCVFSLCSVYSGWSVAHHTVAAILLHLGSRGRSSITAYRLPYSLRNTLSTVQITCMSSPSHLDSCKADSNSPIRPKIAFCNPFRSPLLWLLLHGDLHIPPNRRQ